MTQPTEGHSIVLSPWYASEAYSKWQSDECKRAGGREKPESFPGSPILRQCGHMLRQPLDLLVKAAQFVEGGDRPLKLGPVAVGDLVKKRLDRRLEIELRFFQELRRLVDR